MLVKVHVVPGKNPMNPSMLCLYHANSEKYSMKMKIERFVRLTKPENSINDCSLVGSRF